MASQAAILARYSELQASMGGLSVTERLMVEQSFLIEALGATMPTQQQIEERYQELRPFLEKYGALLTLIQESFTTDAASAGGGAPTGNLDITGTTQDSFLIGAGGASPVCLNNASGSVSLSDTTGTPVGLSLGALLASSLGLTTPLPVASGGTGGANAADARSALGLSLPLPVASGGTGGTTQADARTNLGLSLPLAVASGGTGSTDAAAARTALGAAANAYSSSVSGFTPATVAAAINELASRRKLSGFSSNANGTYVQWEDGFQICMSQSDPVATDVASGGVFVSNNINIVFPAAFTHLYHCGLSAEYESGFTWPGFCSFLYGSAYSSMTLRLHGSTSASSGRVNLFAIGRWK